MPDLGSGLRARDFNFSFKLIKLVKLISLFKLHYFLADLSDDCSGVCRCEGKMRFAGSFLSCTSFKLRQKKTHLHFARCNLCFSPLEISEK